MILYNADLDNDGDIDSYTEATGAGQIYPDNSCPSDLNEDGSLASTFVASHAIIQTDAIVLMASMQF